MQASHEPSQARELFRTQFRLESPRPLREDREHHLVDFENTLSPVVRERADNGNFTCFEGLEKIVLGLNRGAAPAAGAVKFDDDVGAFFHLDIVHAILHRIERVETARATPAQFLGGVENYLWKNLQEVVRHSGHPKQASTLCILPRVRREFFKCYGNE